MKYSRQYDWSYWLLYPYMMVALIPMVAYTIRMRFALPLLGIWLMFALARRRALPIPPRASRLFGWTIVFLWLYLGLDILQLLFGVNSEGIRWQSFADGVHIMGGMLLIHLSVRNSRLRELRHLVLFIFLCMGVGAMMTLLGNHQMEGAARKLTSYQGGTELVSLGDAMYAVESGVGSYGLVYSWGLLAFPMCWSMRGAHWTTRLLLGCLAFLFVVTVYRAEFSICTAGMFVAGGLLAIATVNGSRLLLKTVGVVVVAMMVLIVVHPPSMGFLAHPLLAWRDTTTSREYQSRIEAVADTFTGKDKTYFSYRSELYWKSWRTFLAHPFFGNGPMRYLKTDRAYDELSGGHSHVFDLLAEAGVIGLGIFLMVFILHYKYLRVMSATVLGFRWWPAYYIFLFPACAIAFVNPLFGYTIYLIPMLYLPALALYRKEPVDSNRFPPAAV